MNNVFTKKIDISELNLQYLLRVKDNDDIMNIYCDDKLETSPILYLEDDQKIIAIGPA